jgi:hypothetical protein
MVRRATALTLVICLLLQAGCATKTGVVRVGARDYAALNDVKRIFVTMKTGERLEIHLFVVTDEAIVGTAVTRGADGAPALRPVTLKMQDVASIEVENAESSGGGSHVWWYVLGGCMLGGLALVAAALASLGSAIN